MDNPLACLTPETNAPSLILCSQPTSPSHCKDEAETKCFSLLPDSFGFFRETDPRPLYTVQISLPRSQPSSVFLPMQDKRKENSSCSAAASSAGSNSPPGLSRIWASPARHLWHCIFHFLPLIQIFECDPLLDLCRVLPRPHSSEGVWYKHHQFNSHRSFRFHQEGHLE